MYQDKKDDMMKRWRFQQWYQNYKDNQEKAKNPVQSTINGIGNAYKAVSGFNKGMEALNKLKQPQLSAIGEAANSSMPINNLGSSIMDNGSIMNANTSNLLGSNSSSNAIGSAINSNVMGNASNLGASAVGDAINGATQGATQGASQATGALSKAGGALGKVGGAAGAIGGALSAGNNFAKGDYTNGAMDVAKTGAMFIPGVGWAVAGAIQIAQMLKNAFDKKRQQAMQKGQEEAAKAQAQAINEYEQKKSGFDELQQENKQKLQNTMQMFQQPQDNSQVVTDLQNRLQNMQYGNIGQYGQGNIDLYNRPQVQNPDGSISTVRSKSFNIDGKETLIPTVSDDGRIMSDDEAIDNFYKTGKHLGQFDSIDEANKYAQDLHNQQEGLYTGGAANITYNSTPDALTGSVQPQGYAGDLPDINNYAEENDPELTQDEVAEQQQYIQNPQTIQPTDLKTSLMDKVKSGLSDFAAGYQDNANTDFAHGDLMNQVTGGAAPVQQGNTFNLGVNANKKSAMARLGELAGTGQRIMAHPLTQAAIAGGISRMAGGDIDDIAKAAFQYGSQKAAADRYYQQVTGNTDRPFLNSYSAQDVTNKRLEDAMNQKQQQWMYEQMIKKAQQDWNNQFKQEQFDYAKQNDKEKNALKREEIAARRKYWETRGTNSNASEKRLEEQKKQNQIKNAVNLEKIQFEEDKRKANTIPDINARNQALQEAVSNHITRMQSIYGGDNPSGQKVRMQAPDGSFAYVDSSKVDYYTKKGAKVVK